MIHHWFWERTAQASPLARKLGYARDFVRYKARWKRNASEWQPHLEKSRAFIREAVQQSDSHGLAVVFGSGMCLDVPLEELSKSFRKVLLVDLVHPKEVIRQAASLKNVELCLADLTGVLPVVAASMRDKAVLSLEAMGQVSPQALNAELPQPGSADLVISANTLAQLPLIPMERLWRTGLYSDRELEAFAGNLIAGHIAWLRSFDCPCRLVTDLNWISLGEQEAQTTAPLYDADLGAPQERWEWRIAPKPEAHPSRDILHIVGAYAFPQGA